MQGTPPPAGPPPEPTTPRNRAERRARKKCKHPLTSIKNIGTVKVTREGDPAGTAKIGYRVCHVCGDVSRIPVRVP